MALMKTLAAVEKYEGTVAKIDQIWLRPCPYSGL